MNFKTVSAFAALKKSYEELVVNNERRNDAIARGALSCNMSHYNGREKYLETVLPVMQELFDDEKEAELLEALEEVKRNIE